MQAVSPWRRIAAVCGRDLGEIRKSPASKAIVIVFAALSVAVAIGAKLLLDRVLMAGAGADASVADGIVRKVVGAFLLENSSYGITMLPFSLLVWVFAGAIVMREKLTGNLETLLATPLSLPEIWLGKTLALSAMATGIGWLSGLLAVVAAHCVVAATLGRFVFLLSAPAIVAAFVLNPLFFSGMCALILIIALAKDADASLLPSFLIGMGAMIGLPVGIGTGAINIGSWAFCLYQTGASALLWCAVLAILFTTKKENVVLSARK
jgi:hypothetical protein